MTELRRARFQLMRAELEKRFGAQVLVRLPAIATGFAALDELIGGVPRGALTLLSGCGAAGKLTLAYRVLAHAQREQPHPPVNGRATDMKPGEPGIGPAEAGFAVVARRFTAEPPTPGAAPVAGRSGPDMVAGMVGILDLAASADPDYLAQCGVALDGVLFARPPVAQPPAPFLLDWIGQRRLQALLVDHAPALAATPERARQLRDHLPQLLQALAQSGCALIAVDESQPAWQAPAPSAALPLLRSHAALHIAFEHERWLEDVDGLCGYSARVQVLKHKGARSGQTVSLKIDLEDADIANAL